MSTPGEDREVGDRLVDHLLQQQLGGHAPPDLADRVAAASRAQLERAAAHVDDAHRLAQDDADDQRSDETIHHRRRHIPLLSAALVLASAAVLWLWATATRPTVDVDVDVDVDAQTQLLLDEFHAAMPRYPAMLRDARRRRAVSADALPVIRALLRHRLEHPDETRVGDRAVEFEAYAAMLGDAEIRAGLARRGDEGDDTARAALHAADFAVGDEATRAAALEALCDVFRRSPDAGARIARCLDVAELRDDEVERLTAATSESNTRLFLLRSAQRAASSPRRLLGEPLPLAGATLGGQPFDVATLRGRAVLVCFWATWCPPSLAELDRVRAVQRGHPELAVVAVSCDHDRAALRNYVADHSDDWVHLFDAARPGWHELAFASRVHALPLTVLLDADGVVREVAVGANADDLRAAVRAVTDR